MQALAYIDLGMNMKLSTDDMQRIGATSLMLSDGSGYVGALSVYHELHCLVCLVHAGASQPLQ